MLKSNAWNYYLSVYYQRQELDPVTIEMKTESRVREPTSQALIGEFYLEERVDSAN